MKAASRCMVLVISILLVVTAAAQTFIVPPDSLPYGKSYNEWSAAWWQWADSIPYDHNPMVDTNGAYCGVSQHGPVWFLAGTVGSEATRSCTIPRGKMIFFPIINVINDYPCPVQGFQPGPRQTLEQFLTIGYGSNVGARQYIDHVVGASASLDDQPVQDLLLPPEASLYRTTSPMFFFRGDPSLQVLDPCLPKAFAAVADGYWVMLKPPSRGTHKLVFSGTWKWPNQDPFTVTLTYYLTIN